MLLGIGVRYYQKCPIKRKRRESWDDKDDLFPLVHNLSLISLVFFSCFIVLFFSTISTKCTFFSYCLFIAQHSTPYNNSNLRACFETLIYLKQHHFNQNILEIDHLMRHIACTIQLKRQTCHIIKVIWANLSYIISSTDKLIIQYK